jgi:hypothetical protein
MSAHPTHVIVGASLAGATAAAELRTVDLARLRDPDVPLGDLAGAASQ